MSVILFEVKNEEQRKKTAGYNKIARKREWKGKWYKSEPCG